MDAKQTLINLHRRFPDMDLDELFSILECISEGCSTYTTTTYNPDHILGPKIY